MACTFSTPFDQYDNDSMNMTELKLQQNKSSIGSSSGVDLVPLLQQPRAIQLGYQFMSHIMEDLFHPSSDILPKQEGSNTTLVIITDEHVAAHGHLATLLTALHQHPISGCFRLLHTILTPGEGSKTREQKSLLEDWLLEHQCTRDTCIIALGGGVIGDLSGFLAATFMRGVKFIQIPTTLLAMVDSSIGGKTGVDTVHGKNLIGAFHQPQRIYMDLSFLCTLPRREFVNGLAEVIKTAAIWDLETFDLLENHVAEILALNQQSKDNSSEDFQLTEKNLALLKRVILGSVAVKAHIVTIDERETGLRGLLNFGHTVGHAIEAIVTPLVLHGECIAFGLIKEAEIARHLGYIDSVVVGRLVRCLQAYGLPVTMDRIQTMAPDRIISVPSMMNFMSLDKKNAGGRKKIVLLAGIGKTVEPRASIVDDAVIKKILAPSIQVYHDFSIKKNYASYEEPDAIIHVPGSKSISNRALLMAALGNGSCRLHGLLHSDDVQVMLNALTELVGISYNWLEDGKVLKIEGGGGRLKAPNMPLYLGNAGTAARFLTSVCSLVPVNAGTETSDCVLTGNNRMKQRPIGPLVDALLSKGVLVKYLEGQGCLPLSITPGNGLNGGTIRLAASISSQYVSSLLQASPYAKHPVTLELVGGAVVSQPYIDMTIAMMQDFGIGVTRDPGTDIYHIPLGVYQNPPGYHIEGDASSATYPLAFAAIHPGARVRVANIASSSIQGDAHFVQVLASMGCQVKQNYSFTEVQGPNVLRPVSLLDMESMTDAFLTASVLAAVAQGPSGEPHITRIVGIANQRVKECNRIAAMVKELGKFGVFARELPDGIEIHGKPIANLIIPQDGVDCYDDHRIAMSFSILASALTYHQSRLASHLPSEGTAIHQGVVIHEKKCVEKTWPAWWDVLEKELGVTLSAPLEGEIDIKTPSSESKAPFAERSCIFIGMRGVGKSGLARAVAPRIGWEWIDMDLVFEKHVGMPISTYLQAHSWGEFRALEVELLQQTLVARPTKFLISCGGGIVETEAGRSLLSSWQGRVLHIKRDIKDIIAESGMANATRPLLCDTLDAVWARRQPWYEQVSSSVFFAALSHSNWNAVEHTLAKMLSNSPASDIIRGRFFVSLTCSTINDVAARLDSITTGCDAIELRVDCLASHTIDFISEQVSILRQYSSLPIIYTLRTVAQGGKFSGDSSEALTLLLLGERLGCELIDVEDHLLAAAVKQKRPIQSGGSRIIGSFHSIDRTLTSSELQTKYDELCTNSDVVKIIGFAKSLQDNITVLHFSQTIASIPSSKPLIALNMGPLGVLTRIMNTVLTPVTHPELPIKAAPGQLSIREIFTRQTELGMMEGKVFYLFGCPISASLSPTLHNTGFKILGLPHRYVLCESRIVADYTRVLAELDFGGASVTIPHKMAIIPFVSELTESARAIGAVNTLFWADNGGGGVEGKGRILKGDNTDWKGMVNVIRAASEQERVPLASGVVLGAGGTARAAIYALLQLGISPIRIHVWNRSRDKLLALCAEFQVHPVEEGPDSLAGVIRETTYAGLVVISTLPAAAHASCDLERMLFGVDADVTRGIFLDMAYYPRPSALLSCAASHGHVTLDGLSVLVEQGLEQFKLWTGLSSPPRSEMMMCAVSGQSTWTQEL